MDESCNHNGEQKKSDMREHILCDQMCMKLQNQVTEPFYGIIRTYTFRKEEEYRIIRMHGHFWHW